MLTDIIWKFTVVWHAGNVGCKIVRFMQVSSTSHETKQMVIIRLLVPGTYIYVPVGTLCVVPDYQMFFKEWYNSEQDTQ